MVEPTQTTTTEDTAKLMEPQVPAAQPDVKVAQAEGDTPKPEPKYTDADLEQRVNSVKGGYEGTLKKLKEDIKAAREEVLRAQESSTELGYEKFLKNVEARGGDVDVAKQVIDAQRSVAKRAKELKDLETSLKEQLSILNEAGRAKKARDLVTELKLDAKAEAELIKAENEQAMETTALRLALQSRAVAATPPKVPGQIVPRPMGGKDLSKMSDTEKMGWALEQIGKA